MILIYIFKKRIEGQPIYIVLYAFRHGSLFYYFDDVIHKIVKLCVNTIEKDQILYRVKRQQLPLPPKKQRTNGFSCSPSRAYYTNHIKLTATRKTQMSFSEQTLGFIYPLGV
jgi:hypothetical protein